MSKNIFCQCMKPWKMCINKPKSYKIDARDLLDVWKINKYIFNTTSKSLLEINYDFINLEPTNTKFVCRFSNSPNKSIK